MAPKLDWDENTYPSLGRYLNDLASKRDRHSQMLRGGKRAEGFEALCRRLDAVEESWSQDATLGQLAGAVSDVTGTIKLSFDLALSGRTAAVSDQMRRVIEATWLFWMFAGRPDLIDSWITSSDEGLRKEYSPKNVRKLAKIDFATVTPRAADYGRHSQTLHFGPPAMPGTDFLSRTTPPAVRAELLLDLALLDIFGHSLEFGRSLVALACTLSPGDGDPVERTCGEIPELSVAFDRIDEHVSQWVKAFQALRDNGGMA